MADKMTKKDWYATIKEIVEGSDYTDIQGAVEFIDHQIALIDAKAVKSAERAAARKAEGDELRAQVLGVLTNESQTADEVTEKVAAEGVTRAKVISRLSQLCKANLATKEQIKDESGRRIMAYKLASNEEVTD